MSWGTIVLIAVGGLLAIEGAVWAIFPAQMRRMYTEAMAQTDEKTIHIVGAISVLIGVIFIGMAVKLAAM